MITTRSGRTISPEDFVKELESQGMALSEAQAYVENIVKGQAPKENKENYPDDYPDYGLRRDGTLFIRPGDFKA